MEIKTETLHGRTVSYAEAGAGPVLLLVHGMGGSSENWRAVIEPLARDHTVIVPDLPGHGLSAPGGGITPWAGSPRGSAIFSSCSAMSGPRSSGTRSGAESRCSSPTNFQRSSNVWSWSPAGA